MKLSVSTGHLVPRYYNDEEAIRLLARIGFDAVDYGFTNHHRHTGIFTADGYQDYARNLRHIAEECGIVIGQTHANYPSYTGNPEEDRHMLWLYEREIIATSLMGCKYMVIHPAAPDWCVDQSSQCKAFDINTARLKSLQPCAEEHDVVICIENINCRDKNRKYIPSSCSDAKELIRCLETLDSDRFGACLDIGHANLLGLSIADEIRALGKHLRVLHVHDNSGSNDDHVTPFFRPGLVSVDWDSVCAALRETGYSGTFNLETDGAVCMYPAELAEDAMVFLEKIGRYFINHYRL